MHHKQFLQQLEDAKIAEAIAKAESNTTGEVRVFITHSEVKDAVAAAQHQFKRLKMNRTPARNAVLLFIAPKSQQFAIIGDTAVHERCGQPFWDMLAAELGKYFKLGDFTGGLIHVIALAGRLLAEQFPSQGPRSNELPDDVLRD
ncbi:hypothetical protein BH10PLA1_BH10PLA1_07780 [soil metagenome]